MNTRPAASFPGGTRIPAVSDATDGGAGFSAMQWRRSLKVGDTVAVYCGSVRMQDAVVTSAPESFVTIGQYRGKMNFNRRTGKLSTHRPLAHLFRIERPT